MSDKATSPTTPTSCEGCGACCGVVAIPPFLRHLDGTGEEAWERLRWDRGDLHEELLVAERILLANREGFQGRPCLWYDAQTKSCVNHPWRPAACRAVEIGGLDCLDARRRAGIKG